MTLLANACSLSAIQLLGLREIGWCLFDIPPLRAGQLLANKQSTTTDEPSYHDKENVRPESATPSQKSAKVAAEKYIRVSQDQTAKHYAVCFDKA